MNINEEIEKSIIKKRDKLLSEYKSLSKKEMNDSIRISRMEDILEMISLQNLKIETLYQIK